MPKPHPFFTGPHCHPEGAHARNLLYYRNLRATEGSLSGRARPSPREGAPGRCPERGPREGRRFFGRAAGSVAFPRVRCGRFPQNDRCFPDSECEAEFASTAPVFYGGPLSSAVILRERTPATLITIKACARPKDLCRVARGPALGRGSRAMPGKGPARGEGDSSVRATGSRAFPRGRRGRSLGITGGFPGSRISRRRASLAARRSGPSRSGCGGPACR